MSATVDPHRLLVRAALCAALRAAAAAIERMKNGYSGTLISRATIACTTVSGSPPMTAHKQYATAASAIHL